MIMRRTISLLLAAMMCIPSGLLQPQRTQAYADELPGSHGTPTTGLAPPIELLDPATLRIVDSENARTDISGQSLAQDLRQLTQTIDPSRAGFFACHLESADGRLSALFFGGQTASGQKWLKTTLLTFDQVLELQEMMQVRGAPPIAQGPGFFDHFWSDYWHYLTHPWDMDDDLEYTFYGAVGTAVVAGGAAGGLVVVGVNPVIIGGGGVAAGGTGVGSTLTGGTIINANRLWHIFGQARHNLARFLQHFSGNQTAAFEAVQNATVAALARAGITSGTFEITVTVAGMPVTVRGVVQNGIVYIGTFFM